MEDKEGLSVGDKGARVENREWEDKERLSVGVRVGNGGDKERLRVGDKQLRGGEWDNCMVAKGRMGTDGHVTVCILTLQKCTYTFYITWGREGGNTWVV